MPLWSRLRSLLGSAVLLVPLLVPAAQAQAVPAGALDVADVVPEDLAVPGYAIEGLELADLLLVSAYEPEPPIQSVLLATDGTAAGTRVLLRLATTLDALDVAGGLAVYAARSGDTSRIWVSDGTTAGSRSVASVTGEVLGGRAVGDRVVLLVGDGPDEGIWSSDGTAAGFIQLASAPTRFLEIEDGAVLANGRLVFHDFSDDLGPAMPRIWSTDGTAAGTFPIATTANGSALGQGSWFVGATDGHVVPFTARVPGVGTELFVTDGTVAGTELLASFTPGAASSRIGPMAYEPVSDLFYAVAGPAVDDPTAEERPDLWQIPPITAGGSPVFVSDLDSPAEPPTNRRVRHSLATHRGLVLWTVQDLLWSSDASATPVFLADLLPDSDVGSVDFYGAGVGQEVVVQVIDRAVTRDVALWASDGTLEGTRPYPQPELGELASEPAIEDIHVSDRGLVYAQVRGLESRPGGVLDLVLLAPEGPVSLTGLEGMFQEVQPILGDVDGRTVFRLAEITERTTGQYVESEGRLWSTDGAVAGTSPLPEIPDAAPHHPDTPPITSPAVPGFRFWVRITPPLRDPIVGTREGACIPETVCVSGALPGRTEVFLRAIGPRPNGLLWPVVTRFTPSLVEVWIEQASTGDTRYYALPATAADSGDLTGLFDRDGFVP